MPYFNKTIFSIFLFAYLPLAPILTRYFPLSLTGSSFWDTEFPFLAILVYILSNGLIKKVSELILLILFLVFVFSVSFFRSHIFNEDLSNTIFNSWFLFFPLLVFIALRNIEFQKIFKIINIILFFQILFHGTLGWLLILGLPTIEFEGISKVVGGRFEGIYGASNVYSNYLFSFFLVFALLNKGKYLLIIICSILVFGGAIASGSRGPLVLLMLTLVFITLKSFQNQKFKTLLIIIILGLFGRFILDWLPLDITNIRLSETGIIDTGRLTKNDIAIEGLSSSVQSLIFGLNGSQLYKNGIDISDNSFTLIPISYGIIVFGLWSLMVMFFSRFKLIYFRNSSIAFYIICIVFIFSINNSILWLPWVYFSIFGYYVLKSKYTPNTGQFKSDEFA